MDSGAAAAAAVGDDVTGTTSKDQELNALKGQAEYFEDALGGIKKRITELEAESKEK